MEEQIGCLSWLDGIRFEAKGIVNPASGEIPVVCASQMRLRCSRPPCWAKCIFASFSSSYYIETRNPELFGLKVFEAQDLRWWICPNAAVSDKNLLELIDLIASVEFAKKGHLRSECKTRASWQHSAGVVCLFEQLNSKCSTCALNQGNQEKLPEGNFLQEHKKRGPRDRVWIAPGTS